jgi:hypothetical protein
VPEQDNQPLPTSLNYDHTEPFNKALQSLKQFTMLEHNFEPGRMFTDRNIPIIIHDKTDGVELQRLQFRC